MLLAFFLYCLSRSAFIPYERTFHPMIEEFDEATFDQFRGSIPYSVLLILDDAPSRETQFDIEKFSKAAMLYSDRALFGIASVSSMPKLHENISLDTPFAVFFSRGTPVAATSFPESEGEILYLLRSWLEGPMVIAQTVEELYSMIGNLPISVLARDANIVDAFVQLSLNLPYIGLGEVVGVSDEVMEAVGAKSFPFAVFRLSDLCIVPCKNSSEAIIEASKPIFQVFEGEDFREKDTTFAAIVDFQYNSSYRESLIEIAQQYPQLKFGVLEEPLFSYVQRVGNETLDEFPNFVIFNFERGFCYPMNGSLKGVDPTSDKWKTLVKSILQRIIDGNLEKRYYSEAKPGQNESLKLVGSAFADFVNDTSNEQIVMFVIGHDKEKESEFSYAAKNVSEVIGIKFGIINIVENSSPYPFPNFVQMPHIEFYPRTNKSSSVPMFGSQSVHGYIRFLKENSEHSKFIRSEKMDTKTASYEIENIEGQLPSMSSEIRSKAESYLKHLYEEIGVSAPGTTPAIERRTEIEL